MSGVYLVRHGRAIPKREWTRPDAVRPLTPTGWLQAETLVDRLAPYPVTRVLTSPTERCRQTVEPLAKALRIEIEAEPALAVGSTLGLVRALADRPDMGDAVWCTHGELLREVLDWLAPSVDGQRRLRAEKGSVWFLEGLPDSPRLGTHLSPNPP